MSIADDLFEQAKAHAECYRAGVLAGDTSGQSARKLALLIAAIEGMIPDIEWIGLRSLAEKLRAAISKAKP